MSSTASRFTVAAPDWHAHAWKSPCSSSQTQDEDVLSATTIRSLVRMQGQIRWQAEQAEVTALATRDNLATVDLNLVPHELPRRRAAWPAELNAAVDAALTREQVRPPDGVSWADWERVHAAPCRSELSA